MWNEDKEERGAMRVCFLLAVSQLYQARGRDRGRNGTADIMALYEVGGRRGQRCEWREEAVCVCEEGGKSGRMHEERGGSSGDERASL